MSRNGMSPANPLSQQKPPQRPRLFLLDNEEDDLVLLPLPVVQLTSSVAAEPPLLQKVDKAIQTSPALQPQTTPPIAKPVLPPFAENAENQYGRYVPNSLLISHLLRRNDTGEVFQYGISPTGIYEVPVVKPLIDDVSAYKLPNGNLVFHGKTDDGIDMVSSRSYPVSIGDIEYTFIPLSPLKGKRLSSDASFVERFKKTKEAKEVIESTEIYVKAGQLNVVNTDIARRADTPRTPDQNTVMGMSAVEVYKGVLQKHRAILTNDAIEIMETASNTLWRGSTIFEAQLRPEHLHLLGYGYYPMEVGAANPHLRGELSTPQRVSNLGAARRCDNTRMMFEERTGERFIRRYPDAQVTIGGAFTMLLNTEVINTIYFWVQIVRGDFKAKLTQKIDTFERDPQFCKASDMATLVEIFSMMVQNVGPLSIKKVNLSETPAISRFPRNFYQLKKKPVAPTEEMKKRPREDVVVMPAPVEPIERPIVASHPERKTVTRTPFLFAASLANQRAEAVNAMRKAALEEKAGKKVVELDEDDALLLN